MQVIRSVHEIKAIVEKEKKAGKRVGFVPTMGALHEGHLSLASYSIKGNQITVVSIFVNPTQFNDVEDLKNYPRMLKIDLNKLAPLGVDYVFAPSELEMYPKQDNREFEFGTLDKVMEGAHRQGHFKGVAQIVSKLFEAVPAHSAYFGDKDFQQVAIIRKLVYLTSLSIEIVSCPIVREADGLAMSSRNIRLSTRQRASSPLIYATLKNSTHLQSTLSIEEVKNWVCNVINKNVELKIEYFEIVDETSLLPIRNWAESEKKIGCIAVNVGNVRLIDNIRY